MGREEDEEQVPLTSAPAKAESVEASSSGGNEDAWEAGVRAWEGVRVALYHATARVAGPVAKLA